MTVLAVGLPSIAISDGIAAALPDHIVAVVGLRPEEQVRGVHAGRVVATVENTLAVRDRAVDQLPRDTMRLARVALYGELAVAEPYHYAGGPQPTAIRLPDLRPKPRDVLDGHLGLHKRNINTRPTA